MDNAWTLDTSDAGKFAAAVVEQGVDQSAVGIARRGMHDHARFLVQNEQVVVFVKDVERDILWRGIERHRFRQRDGNAVAGLHRIARLGGLVIDDDVLLANERLDARA